MFCGFDGGTEMCRPGDVVVKWVKVSEFVNLRSRHEGGGRISPIYVRSARNS